MKFIATLVLSVLAASVQAGNRHDAHGANNSCEFFSSSSSSSSTSCDISSSSSGSSICYQSNRHCKKELAHVEDQPCNAASNYLKGLEAQVKANSELWLNDVTRAETATAFASYYSLIVNIIGALGQGTSYPGAIGTFSVLGFTAMRSYALNKGVYAFSGVNDDDSYYTFPLINYSTSERLFIQFVVPRSQLPLNNITYKRGCLRN